MQLTYDLQELGMEHIQDIRWTHLHLYLKSNTTRIGCDGRCELLHDGTLSFKGVESIDEGSYIQEVFDREGKLLKKTEFRLRVETGTGTKYKRIKQEVKHARFHLSSSFRW